jgi:ATP-dependent Lon protease
MSEINNPDFEATVDLETGNVFDPTSTEHQELPTVPEELALLPLRDAVVFPLLVAPIAVGREPYVRLIDDAVVGNNRILGIVTQKSPEIEQPTPLDIYGTGVAVSVRMMGKGDQATRLIVQGIQRFQILEVIQEEPYLRAKVRLIDESAPVTGDEAIEVEALKRQLGQLFRRVVDLSPDMPEELKGIEGVESPYAMTDLMAAHARLSTADKMTVLETLDLKERMNKLLGLLTHESQVLELGANLQNQAASEMGKAQRDYFLREQMKAIQRELGEGDDRAQEFEELKTRLAEANLPEDARKEADRELDRLQRMSPGSPEYTVARTYVELMASLPWSRASDDNLDIPFVKEVLDEDHYGLEKVKDRILEYLSVRKFKAEGTSRQPILCLVGPPGVGKTSLGRSIARALNKEFYRLSLGGVRDEAEVRGHRRTYIGAMPGQIIQGIKRAGTNNPVFLLDEIDKVSSDFRGDPSSALLEVLDPEQNKTFRDNYLDVTFDLSRVLFITTANQLDTIQGPLRDRMEIIEIAGYTEEEKTAIAIRHLLPKQIGEHGLTAEQVTITGDAVQAIVRGYTREAGVRSLERQIASVLRKVTRAFAEGRIEPMTIDAAAVLTFLGAPRFEIEELAERTDEAGVATGLAWTPVGGDVLIIETQKMTGGKGLQLTGQLGDVMQESAKTALSFVRSHADALGIDPKFWADTEIHVHVPAGAIPKDGPSAGVTMTTAIASLLSGRKVKPRLAMTGEVTLTGKVLPVGGIKEKVLAARRAGVTTIILPEKNRKDLDEDIAPELRKGITFHFARHVTEVLDAALEPVARPRKIRVKSAEKASPLAKNVPVGPGTVLPDNLPRPNVPPARA